MTVDEVKKRVEQILAHYLVNREHAHVMEDELWQDVLEEVASKRHNMQTIYAMCREALRTRSAGDSRCYA